MLLVFCERHYECSALLVYKHWVWVWWGETSFDLFFQNVMIIMNYHDHDEDDHNDSELSMMRWGEGKGVLLTFSSLRCCRQSIYTQDEKTHKLFENRHEFITLPSIWFLNVGIRRPDLLVIPPVVCILLWNLDNLLFETNPGSTNNLKKLGKCCSNEDKYHKFPAIKLTLLG